MFDVESRGQVVCSKTEKRKAVSKIEDEAGPVAPPADA